MVNHPEIFNLKGRVSAVTGGAGLLGEQFCHTLAEAGSKVVIVEKNESAANTLASTLSDKGYEALAILTDITSSDSVRHMVDITIATFGHLDILVNSAALDPKFDPQHRDTQFGTSVVVGAFEDFPLEAWKQALDVNLTGTFLSCQAAVQPMLRQGSGVIINIASIYGLVGPDQRLYERDDSPIRAFKPVYYSVTKAGILGLTRYLATYYAGKNIRVNTLTPGGVYNGHDETFTRAYAARTVLGRMASKDEMNGALLFLASDASSYMTGANLVVDGGWTTW
jgi:2-deoxy-D-gluconate 3-dehydrogenase